jgi:hypothetical protein
MEFVIARIGILFAASVSAMTAQVAAQVETPAAVEPTKETQPVEVKPAEVKPAEVKPAEVKPAEVKPVETKPVETKPAEPQPAPAALPKLKGAVVMVTTREIITGNLDATLRVMIAIDSPPGSGCDVHLPNGMHKYFSNLRPGDNLQSNLKQWSKDPNPDPNKAREWALIECRDAASYLKFSLVAK